MDIDSDSGYDIERQGTAWNRRSINSSAFSHLEGRSYRFQQSQDTSNPGTSIVPGSYTATFSSIRDETAQLAGMIMSDDEGNASTSGSHIYDIGEEDSSSPNSQLFPPPRTNGAGEFSPTTSPIVSLGVQAGPSNLSRAMAASQATSPQSAKTATPADDDGSQATPRVTTSVLGFTQPVATPQPWTLKKSKRTRALTLRSKPNQAPRAADHAHVHAHPPEVPSRNISRLQQIDHGLVIPPSPKQQDTLPSVRSACQIISEPVSGMVPLLRLSNPCSKLSKAMLGQAAELRSICLSRSRHSHPSGRPCQRAGDPVRAMCQPALSHLDSTFMTSSRPLVPSRGSLLPKQASSPSVSFPLSFLACL